MWERAQEEDRDLHVAESKHLFQRAAEAFFHDAEGKLSTVKKPLNEYSTLMDSFSCVQEARLLKSRNDFEAALSSFAKATDILRATVHFAFLASYVSACASLETAIELGNSEDAVQGFRNGIGLFEQSKLALSFRDERHPILRSINALIKYSISKALLVESKLLEISGSADEAEAKKTQAFRIESELSQQADPSAINDAVPAPIRHFRITYFPLDDYRRAMSGAFLTVFPEGSAIWIGNIGSSAARVVRIGGEKVRMNLPSSDSSSYPLNEFIKGKVRIMYEDEVTKNVYDEGCATII